MSENEKTERQLEFVTATEPEKNDVKEVKNTLKMEEDFDILKAIMSKKVAPVKTELVELPSHGIPYPDSWGLKKGVKVRAFTTEDKRLGTVDSLISKCIIRDEKDFNYNVKNLISADKEMLYIRIRALTFGENFEQQVKCMSCGAEFEHKWKLDELEVSYFEVDSYPFYFTLPDSGLRIGFKLLLDKDQEEIKQELTKMAKRKRNFNISEEQNVYYLCQSIVSINSTNVPDLDLKYQWFNTLSINDSTFIYNVFESVSVGIKITDFVDCPFCGRNNLVVLPLNETFLRPKFETPKGIGVKTAKFNELGKE